MYHSAIFCKSGTSSPDLKAVFPPRLRTHIETRTRLFPRVITQENFSEFAPYLDKVGIIFATWGMWELSPPQIDALPNLNAVFYAAGSVRYFAKPLLQRGVVVTSSWQANAVPVAEFTLSQILLANKGYWHNLHDYQGRSDYGAFRGRGNYGSTVTVLGAGQIGRRVIEFLRPFHLRVQCFDPYLTAKGADLLEVEKIDSLAGAFESSNVVSNHLADLPATYGLIRGAHLDLMPRNATFINTGRGRTVNHEELLQVLGKRRDMTALLDVTDPEPLPLGHPLRTLPNVHLTNHIAGSIGDEVERMGQMAFEEFDRFDRGQALRYAVTLEMLETMA
jgi:phosphoglycerate dehydrogenase-like enzyme